MAGYCQQAILPTGNHEADHRILHRRGIPALTIADSQEIATTLATSCPETLIALCSPRAARFGAFDGYHGPAFAAAGEGRLTIRLRLDDLAQLSPEAQAGLPQLRAAISQHQRHIRLAPGQAVSLATRAACTAGPDTRATV